MLETEAYECPYCGEPAEAVLDLSGGTRRMLKIALCAAGRLFSICRLTVRNGCSMFTVRTSNG